MECGRILSYLLYGSVASLLSPVSNIEAWPYGTSLRFAPAFRALGVCEHIWLRYKNFDPSCFDPIQKFGTSTWGLTLIFDPVPSTYFRPPLSTHSKFVDFYKLTIIPLVGPLGCCVLFSCFNVFLSMFIHILTHQTKFKFFFFATRRSVGVVIIFLVVLVMLVYWDSSWHE